MSNDLKEDYYTSDGHPITLENLCLLEPMWAANVIRKLKEDLQAERGWVEKYRDAYTKDSAKLAEAGYKTLEAALEAARKDKK